MQSPVAVQNKQRTNCFKPMVACVLGPILAMTCLVGCACACVGVLAFTSPAPPDPEFEPSRTLAQSYEDSIVDTLQNAVSTGGTFILNIQDDAFASWLNLEYKDLAEKYDLVGRDSWQGMDPEFQVQFDNGEIQLYVGQDIAFFTLGSLVAAELSPPASEFSPYLIDINITTIKIGGLEFDESSSRRSLERRLAEVLTDRLEAFVQLTAGIERIEIDTVLAEDGILTLTGHTVQ